MPMRLQRRTLREGGVYIPRQSRTVNGWRIHRFKRMQPGVANRTSLAHSQARSQRHQRTNEASSTIDPQNYFHYPGLTEPRLILNLRRPCCRSFRLAFGMGVLDQIAGRDSHQRSCSTAGTKSLNRKGPNGQGENVTPGKY
jgi:hypothetical protein